MRYNEGADMQVEAIKKKKTHFRRFCRFCLTIISLTLLSVILVVVYVKPPIPASSTNDSVSGGAGASVPQTGDDESKSSAEDLAELGAVPEIDGSGRKENVFTMVVAGLDLDKTRTDTILLVSMNASTKELAIMQIPRDTRAYKANGNVHKINAAYGVDIDRMKTELKNTVGFYVDKYVIIDYQAFEELIDAIGGVEVDVSIDMKYKDPDQDLVIDIPKGLQKLDGENALKYMRYRDGYPDADLGRIRAQQKLIKVVAEKMMTPTTLFLVPKLVEILNKNVITDLTVGEMIWLGTAALSMNYENLRIDTLPGEAEGADFAADPDATLELINAYYNPYLESVTKLKIP